MKPVIFKSLALIVLISTITKLNAQNGLLAINTVNTVQSPNKEAALFNDEEKIRISDITEDPANKSSLVRINSVMQLTMQVKVFDMNGDLAKIETHTVNSGVTDVNVDLNSLAAGTYMIQFYTKEGSAIRRFIKNN